ncbi:MAG: hypothetical protein U9P12_02685 [Verrucomicrobiota bacterium]|nr:hypothetical protein [Verrucomicrobiota bacterium]
MEPRFLFQRLKSQPANRNTATITTMGTVSLGAGAHRGMVGIGSMVPRTGS